MFIIGLFLAYKFWLTLATCNKLQMYQQALLSAKKYMS